MSITTALDDGVFSLGFNRPEKKNALTQAMYADSARALRQAEQDPAVRVILLHGHPQVFTAGNDLEDFLREPPRDLNSPTFDFMRALVEGSKPVVAAVNGPAVGIGTTLLLHCDLVYLGDDARLRMPFTSLGLCAEFGSSLLVPRLAGHARAAAKLLLADPITPAEALEFGMATAVLPAAEVLAQAQAQCRRLANAPQQAVRETRRLMRKADQAAVLAAIEEEARVFMRLLGTPEAREAFTAFFEKRQPDFRRVAS